MHTTLIARIAAALADHDTEALVRAVDALVAAVCEDEEASRRARWALAWAAEGAEGEARRCLLGVGEQLVDAQVAARVARNLRSRAYPGLARAVRTGRATEREWRVAAELAAETARREARAAG